MVRDDRRWLIFDAISLFRVLSMPWQVGLTIEELGPSIATALWFGYGREKYQKILELGKSFVEESSPVAKVAGIIWEVTLESLKAADREFRISHHHPAEPWLWTPVNDLLRRNNYAPVNSLEPSVPQTDGRALYNARKKGANYYWAAREINDFSDSVRAIYYSTAPNPAWPEWLSS